MLTKKCKCCNKSESMIKFLDDEKAIYESRHLICFDCASTSKEVEKVLILIELNRVEGRNYIKDKKGA